MTSTEGFTIIKTENGGGRARFLYFKCHGDPDDENDRLTECVEEQAKAVGERFARAEITGICSSPMDARGGRRSRAQSGWGFPSRSNRGQESRKRSRRGAVFKAPLRQHTDIPAPLPEDPRARGMEVTLLGHLLGIGIPLVRSSFRFDTTGVTEIRFREYGESPPTSPRVICRNVTEYLKK